jgi:hypothetical protein
VNRHQASTSALHAIAPIDPVNPRSGAKRFLACVVVMLALAGHATQPADATQSDRFTLPLANGALAGASDTIRVKQGDDVELAWSSDKPIELHLHGYDIEVHVAPDKPAVMSFKATIPGRFPIEPHGRARGTPHAVAYLEVLP